MEYKRKKLPKAAAQNFNQIRSRWRRTGRMNRHGSSFDAACCIELRAVLRPSSNNEASAGRNNIPYVMQMKISQKGCRMDTHMVESSSRSEVNAEPVQYPLEQCHRQKQCDGRDQDNEHRPAVVITSVAPPPSVIAYQSHAKERPEPERRSHLFQHAYSVLSLPATQ